MVALPRDSLLQGSLTFQSVKLFLLLRNSNNVEIDEIFSKSL